MKRKFGVIVALFFIATLSLTAFQNCGSGVGEATTSLNSLSGASDVVFSIACPASVAPSSSFQCIALTNEVSGAGDSVAWTVNGVQQTECSGFRCTISAPVISTNDSGTPMMAIQARFLRGENLVESNEEMVEISTASGATDSLAVLCISPIEVGQDISCIGSVSGSLSDISIFANALQGNCSTADGLNCTVPEVSESGTYEVFVQGYDSKGEVIKSVAVNVIVNEATPEILVEGNRSPILDGDITAGAANLTGFGQTTVGTPVIRTFTVKNIGLGSLITSGLGVYSVSNPATASTSYEVEEGLAETILPGESDTFSVKLLATTKGTFFAEVRFSNNDIDENPFNFRISGAVNELSTPVVPIALWGPQTNTPYNAGTSQTSYYSGGQCYAWTTTDCVASIPQVQTALGLVSCPIGSRYSTDFRTVTCPMTKLTVTKAGGNGTARVGGNNGDQTFSCPAGTNPCSGSFPSGVPFTLKATPAIGYKFVGWSGSCTGTGDCVLPMTAEASVTATFALLPKYKLTLARSPSGLAGSVSGEATSGKLFCGESELTCAGDFPEGMSVQISGMGASGYRFKDCSPGCTVTMTAATTVTVNFETCQGGWSGPNCSIGTCASPEPSCASQTPPRCTLTVGSPTVLNQAWVKAAASCGFSCTNGWSGQLCNWCQSPKTNQNGICQ